MIDVLFGRQKRTGRFICFCLRLCLSPQPTFNIHWKGTTIHMVSSDEMFSYGNLFHIVPAMFRSKLQTDFLTNSSILSILEDEEESAEDIYDEHECQIKKSHDHWDKKEKDQSQCNEWKHNDSVHTEITASLSMPSVESQSESEPQSQSQSQSQLATNKGHCKGYDNGTNSNSNLFAKLALKPYPKYDVQIEMENAGQTRGIRAPRRVCSMKIVSSSLGSTSGQDPIFYKEVKSSSASASVFTSESVPTHTLLPSFFEMCACGSTVAGLESGDAKGAEVDPAHIEYHTVYGSAIHIQRSQKGNSQCILRMGTSTLV